jgi:hypothetical protein
MAEMRNMAKKAATNGYGKPGHNRGNRKIVEHDHDPAETLQELSRVQHLFPA